MSRFWGVRYRTRPVECERTRKRCVSSMPHRFDDGEEYSVAPCVCVRKSYTFIVMLSAADREIRLGIWKIHILHHAALRDVWGRWLLEELAEHGHELSPGTLYPALLRMENNGWLERTGDTPYARARQTFRITVDGRRLLDGLRKEVAELYEEVVLGHEPEPSDVEPRRAIRRSVTPRRRITRRKKRSR